MFTSQAVQLPPPQRQRERQFLELCCFVVERVEQMEHPAFMRVCEVTLGVPSVERVEHRHRSPCWDARFWSEALQASALANTDGVAFPDLMFMDKSYAFGRIAYEGEDLLALEAHEGEMSNRQIAGFAS